MGKTIHRPLLTKLGKGRDKALEVIKSFPVASLGTIIGTDLNKEVGRPVGGLVIKSAEAKKLLDESRRAVEGNKITQILITLGISGKDMVLVARNTDTWEACVVLVAGYVDLIEEQKKGPHGIVANLDPGDKVIDQASIDMGNKLGTAAVLKGALGDAIGGLKSGDIVLLAHGAESKTSQGQIYGTNFANVPPETIVKLLAGNKDTAKRLSPEYAGTVYLDGCFTAQGAAMENYTLNVWNGLKKAGIPHVKVMGNLGKAATDAAGDETVSPTDQEAIYLKKVARLKEVATRNKKALYSRRLDIMARCEANGADPMLDPTIIKILAAEKAVDAKFTADCDAILVDVPTRVKNLVGKFGLDRIN